MHRSIYNNNLVCVCDCIPNYDAESFFVQVAVYPSYKSLWDGQAIRMFANYFYHYLVPYRTVR